MEKNLKIIGCYFRLHYLPFIIIGVLLTAGLPSLVNIKILTLEQSAIVLERFFTIIGIIMFLPLYLPDADANILDIVRTKKTAYLQIILLRLIQILLATFGLLILFLLLLHLNHSILNFGTFFAAELANILFLGGLSSVAFVLSWHPVVSLMVPMLYYVFNFFTNEQKLKVFYLFGLADKEWLSKIVLGSSGIILLLISMWIATKKKSPFLST